MENNNLLDCLCRNMISYFEGDPKRIQHFMKVHSFSRLIGLSENLPTEELVILEAAAYVHDIGIKVAEEKYGKCDGKLQEELGPMQAKTILEKTGFSPTQIERICYLVGHHHTYTNIDGLDYRILVEADFLVNLYEDEVPRDGIISAYRNIFKTEAGKSICKTMYDIEDNL